jgi:VWFA-related protein
MLPEEERGGPYLLSELAEQSGGRHVAIGKLSELPAAAAKIGLELRNQYLVGYHPSKVDSDGKFHKVQVKLVDSGNLQLSWRPGYYAPQDRAGLRPPILDPR